MESVTLHVNGRVRTIAVDASTPLLYVLRNELGLKAAKYGCGNEQCGACRVLVDGSPEFSCNTPVGAFASKEIVTLEGLNSSDELHPIQRAFLEERAAQCGYCTAGIILTTAALFDEGSSVEEIIDALSVHLCRCGSHPRIVKAVRAAVLERS